MNYITVLAIQLFLINYSFSQEATIEGVVSDSQNGQNLSFVQIKVTNNIDDDHELISTDDEGFYSVECYAGRTYTLWVSHSDYKSEEVTVEISEDFTGIITENISLDSLSEERLLYDNPNFSEMKKVQYPDLEIGSNESKQLNIGMQYYFDKQKYFFLNEK